ncbi:MAG: hypothetical protein J6R24_02060, partial [Clostridia bacterium]|nr:hypothetical protein [Clostridia bacterium]
LSGAGKTLTFTVRAGQATTAYLFAGVSKRANQASFESWFSVTVNGQALILPTRTVPAISGGEEEWHTFISVKLVPIELKQGNNTIVFTTQSDSSNFDYIEVYSAIALT